MAKNTQQDEIPSNIEAMALAAQLGVTGNNQTNAKLAELLALQVEREQRWKQRDEEEEEARRRKKETEKKIRLNGAKSALAEQAKRRVIQASCNHLNQKGLKYTGAIRDWRGNLHARCGLCQMQWHGTRAELLQQMGTKFPDEDAISGPIMSS